MVGIEWGQYILGFVFKQCIPQNANFDGANDRPLDFAQYIYIYMYVCMYVCMYVYIYIIHIYIYK